MKNSNKKQITYLNRDYSSILQKLENYTKYYFPDTFNDFSPSSPGMLFLQLTSYVGDVLNFYLDRQINQTFIQTAKDRKSIYDIAQSVGYKIKTCSPSVVQVNVYITMNVGSGVDNVEKYIKENAPIIESGMIVYSSSPSIQFMTTQPVNFRNYDQIDEFSVGQNSYVLMKKVTAYAMQLRQFTYEVDSEYNPNLNIYLPERNIISIKQVIDDESSRWYQVPYMAVDKIPIVTRYDNGSNSFQLLRTNKRFIKKVSPDGRTYIHFGSLSQDPTFNNVNIIENLFSTDQNILLPQSNKIVRSVNYGQVPNGKTLRIKYYVGYVDNISSAVLQTKPKNIIFSEKKYQNYRNSIVVINEKPSYGGQGLEDDQQIKQNVLAFRNTNHRLVTQQDFKNILSSLSGQFASTIYKSFSKWNDKTSQIQVYLLGKDNQNNFTFLSDENKLNIAKYLQSFRMLGTKVRIMNPHIINYGVNFQISVNKSRNKNQILFDCLNVVKKLTDNRLRQINKHIDIYQYYKELYKISGVVNVERVILYNLNGDGYSSSRYDFSIAIKDNIIYPPTQMAIFQMKNPDIDIKGLIL